MKRDIFLPNISTLLIFAMTFFLSCASQNRVKDGLDVAAEDAEQSMVTEEGSAVPEENAGSGELADLTQDPSLQDATPTEGAVPAEGAEAIPPTAEDADLQALGGEATPPPADGTANPETLAMGDANASAIQGAPGDATASLEGQSSSTELDPLTSLEGTGGAVAGAVPTEPQQSETTTEAVPPPSEPMIADAQITKMEPIISSVEPRTSSGGSSGYSGSSRVPKIPSKAVKRAGTQLNRFYFVRTGDTAHSVSQLIYGSEEGAKNLKKWNSNGNWAPGRIVYYQSAIEPNDASMRSFYQEKGVQPEEYAIERGDWLSKIAKKKLGHAASWKEIAVVNGMDSPDSIEVGQKIAIYPKDLSGYSGNPAPEQPKEEPMVQQPLAQQQQPQQPVAPEEPAIQPPQEPVNLAPEQPRVQKTPAVDATKVIEQNLPAVFILGGVLVLSALYLVVRRKKSKKSMDDFGDESFAPPTKLKRK